MNKKLPRLILVGAGSVAVAVFSAFSGKALRNGQSSGSSISPAGIEVAGCGGPGEIACPPASAVRG